MENPIRDFLRREPEPLSFTSLFCLFVFCSVPYQVLGAPDGFQSSGFNSGVAVPLNPLYALVPPVLRVGRGRLENG